MSNIIESLRGDLAELHKAGAVGKVTLRNFDAICPPAVREFSAADIKHLRETLKFSQPVCSLTVLIFGMVSYFMKRDWMPWSGFVFW